MTTKDEADEKAREIVFQRIVSKFPAHQQSREAFPIPYGANEITQRIDVARLEDEIATALREAEERGRAEMKEEAIAAIEAHRSPWTKERFADAIRSLPSAKKEGK
jgi:hypothetical protein